MKFGTKPGSLRLSLTRENTVQKMLICLGLVGIVSVYNIDDLPTSLFKDQHIIRTSTAAVAADKVTVEANAIAAPPPRSFEKYLAFKENVEPGETANFEVKALPGGTKYTIRYGDGAEEDLKSLRAAHVYKKSGDYAVTLLAEFNGQKQPLPPLNIHVHETSEVIEYAPLVEMN